MHIGLIGGIGVAATLVYYKRLTDAIKAAGHVPDLTIVHADAATLVANNRADARDAQARVFAGHLQRLADASADCATITSLGGHFCFTETEAISPLTLVSAIAPIDTYLASQGVARIGLLGTASAMRSALYGQLKTPAVTPDDIATAGKAYEDMALRGAALPEDRQLFLTLGDALIEAGADAILLAGTDLGLVFDEASPPYKVIDAIDIHVAHLAAMASD